MEKWREDLYIDALHHHGILGQRKGRRRYQNEDGSLTTLGRIHYGIGESRASKEEIHKYYEGKVQKNPVSRAMAKRDDKKAEKPYDGKHLSKWGKDHYGKVVDIGDGKFTKKAAEYRKDDREAAENKAMMDDIQKNVQEILGNKKPITEAELLEIRKNNKKVNEAIEKASQKSFDDVVNDVASSDKLGKVAKSIAKNVKKEDIEKASKDAGEAAAKGENPEAAFAKSIIESTGKNMRTERAKNGGKVNGEEVAKTAIAFYERFKDLPTALNSLGSHAGKISEIYSETKAYQRLKNIDLQSMSNADLKREIDRLTLEQNYTRLVASNSQAGEKKVKNIINGVGSSIQIGGSAVMLANAISKARKKYN